MSNCRVCSHQGVGREYVLREVMFGKGDEFRYFDCPSCGCLQIGELPNDLQNFYPADSYYSYDPVRLSGLRLLKENAREYLCHHGPAWLFAGQAWWEEGARKAIRDSGIGKSAEILDIGCGGGSLIYFLRNIGFERVLGVDPYLPAEVVHPNGVRVLNCSVGEIDRKFDLVMMHHSLEHIWDQHAAIDDVVRLLKPGGRCIIRIPTVDSWAWGEYGADWVQLDAPRHLYLHSRKSIVELLAAHGLEVNRLVDDSSAFQILGSEKVRRTRLADEQGVGGSGTVELPPTVVREAPRRAMELNKASQGDAIAVHARLGSGAL